MSAISQLKIASHGGIQFPYTECRVSIQARHHAHVYIHTSGGELEKLGLALRKFSFTIPAHDTLQPPFRNFYSQTLPRLWGLWSSLTTAPLVVPQIGTVQAMATDATRRIGLATSGEPVEAQLLEDSTTLATLDAVFRPSAQTLPTQLRAVVRSAPAAVPQSLLDRLTAAVGQAMSYAAQGDILARQWLTQIGHVAAVCEAIYQTPALALPANVAALDVLLEMHATAIQLRQDAQRRGRAVLTWPSRTPARLSVVQVAAWIYGRTDRATELLALNEWDPLNVPAGSIVRYYA